MLKKSETKHISYAYMTIIIINLLPYIIHIPISIQLFLNSIACIYIGSYRGIIIMNQHELEKANNDKIEKMTAKDAYLFPVYGSVVLFSLYLVFKHIDKSILNTLLTIYFTFFGYLSLIQIISYHIELYFPELERKIIVQKKFNLNLYFYKKLIELALTKSEIIAGIIAIIPTVIYALTKNWLMNNLFGVTFSICGIESLILPNFKVGFILLWGLFFYDIFWVYGTDVMLTVAKSVDAPIKLIFPINLSVDPPSFSMLGLGDIVIPGIFIALCLKYDIDKAILAYNKHLKTQAISNTNTTTTTITTNTNTTTTNTTSTSTSNTASSSSSTAATTALIAATNPNGFFKSTYFKWCIVGYALGIILTFQAMVIFNHPQPALLFLVPCCTLSILLCGLLKREVNQLAAYDEEHIRKQIKEDERKKQ